MRPIRAVFLDAGNTLFTERGSRAAIYAAALRRRGVAIDDETMKEHMGFVHARLPRTIEGHFRYSEGWFRVFVENVAALAGFAQDVSDLTRELVTSFKSAETFRVFDDVRPTLKRMKGAGIRLAVVSNWSPSLPALLGKLGFGSDFEVIVPSALVRMEKPESGIFRRALQELRIAPSEAIHVGDHPVNDIDGAAAAGIDSRLLDRAGEHPGHPSRIAALTDVLPIVGLPSM